MSLEVRKVQAAFDKLNAAEQRQVNRSENALVAFVRKIISGVLSSAIWAAIKSAFGIV